MKTIGDLKEDIAHLPDDTPICEDCNCELTKDGDKDSKVVWYCANEMCLNGE